MPDHRRCVARLQQCHFHHHHHHHPVQIHDWLAGVHQPPRVQHSWEVVVVVAVRRLAAVPSEAMVTVAVTVSQAVSRVVR
jgi:hypothetical protein